MKPTQVLLFSPKNLKFRSCHWDFLPEKSHQPQQTVSIIVLVCECTMLAVNSQHVLRHVFAITNHLGIQIEVTSNLNHVGSDVFLHIQFHAVPHIEHLVHLGRRDVAVFVPLSA